MSTGVSDGTGRRRERPVRTGRLAEAADELPGWVRPW